MVYNKNNKNNYIDKVHTNLYNISILMQKRKKIIMKNKKIIIGIIIAILVCVIGLVIFFMTNKKEIPENAITGIEINSNEDLLVTSPPLLQRKSTE